MKKTLMLAATLLAAGSGMALAQGDPAKGEKAFRKCMACHEVAEGAKNKVGPELNDVVGRTAGTVEGFSYSKAMQEAGAGGLVWTEEEIATFIENPKKAMPGTKMAFPGIKKPEERADIVAYLATFAEGAEAAAEAGAEEEGGA